MAFNFLFSLGKCSFYNWWKISQYVESFQIWQALDNLIPFVFGGLRVVQVKQSKIW